jgi:hypothetical protein
MPWIRIHLYILIAVQLVKKITAFVARRKLIIAFTSFPLNPTLSHLNAVQTLKLWF